MSINVFKKNSQRLKLGVGDNLVSTSVKIWPQIAKLVNIIMNGQLFLEKYNNNKTNVFHLT